MPKKLEVKKEVKTSTKKPQEKFSDIRDIEAKLERIKKHYEKNKQDKRAMREKDRIFAKLRKLKKYHKII